MYLYLVGWIKMIISLLFQTPQPLPPSVSQISVTPENFLEEAPANIFGCPRTKKKVKPRTENVMMSDQSVQKTLFHSPLTPRCVIFVHLENLIFALCWSEEQIQCLRWWTCLILFFYVWFCSFGLLPITPSADQPRVGLPFFTPSPPVNCQADLQAPKKVIFKFNFYIIIKIYEKKLMKFRKFACHMMHMYIDMFLKNSFLMIFVCSQ